MNQTVYFRDTVTGTKSHKTSGRYINPGIGKRTKRTAPLKC